MLLQVITALPVGSKVLAIFGPEGGLTPPKSKKPSKTTPNYAG